MVRFARVVALDVAHHVTQRGNARRFILETDAERGVYLDLVQQGIQRYGVELIGYCLMSNHVHLVAVPRNKDGLARSLKQIHGRFAAYWNAANRSSGHVWQGRYYSCPLDEPHLWEALRYTELNPVRASMVASPEEWPWSSAPAHCGTGPIVPWLSMNSWRALWSSDTWRAFLQIKQAESSQQAIRDSTQSGRPLGSAEFTRLLERQEHRPLTRQKPGPRKRNESGQQESLLSYDAF
jgi:putative transposase